MRGSALQIFSAPAVNVTASSQTSGINVISASAGERGQASRLSQLQFDF